MARGHLWKFSVDMEEMRRMRRLLEQQKPGPFRVHRDCPPPTSRPAQAVAAANSLLMGIASQCSSRALPELEHLPRQALEGEPPLCLLTVLMSVVLVPERFRRQTRKE